MAWQVIVTRTRANLNAKIPEDWRLEPNVINNIPRNVLEVFSTSGLLSVAELEITNVKDATLLLEKLHSSEWSAKKVIRAFCKRAAIAHQLVNCLMDIDFKGAFDQADRLDKYLLENGKPVGPLHGLPISIKDLTAVRGMRYTMGYVSWADNVSDEDAIVVQTLRKAGAIIYVKTTMPQTGMALETNSVLFGRTLNPANTLLSAGGSSGGEAALLACRGSIAGIGTDSGGSIRAPASFNYLYSLKPSSKRISYRGNMNNASGLGIASAIGPMGRSLRDMKLLARILIGDMHWLKDATVVSKEWVEPKKVSKLRIGLIRWDGFVNPHPPIKRAIEMAAARLLSAGHEVIELEQYKSKFAGELARRLYYPTGGKETRQCLAESGEPPIPPVKKSLDNISESTLQQVIQSHREAKQYKDEYLEWWNATEAQTSDGKPIDALLLPTMASASFPHDHTPSMHYLTIYNLLDYPCVTLPITHTDQLLDKRDERYSPIDENDKNNYKLYDPELFHGAPISLVLVGRALEEEQLLAIAEEVDYVLSGHRPNSL